MPYHRSSFFLVALLAAISASCIFAASAKTPPKSMHQDTLEAPEPDGRRPLDINPPTFRWPTFGAAPYTVELGRSADLADAKKEPAVRETFHRPPQPLAPGRYWWRVTDAKGASQPVVSFEVGADVVRWEIPAWEEALAKLPKGRPRLLMRPEDLPRLRQLALGECKELVGAWAKEVAPMIGRRFPEEKTAAKAIEPDENGKRMKRQHVARDFAGGIAGSRVDQLCLVYLLTGEAPRMSREFLGAPASLIV